MCSGHNHVIGNNELIPPAHLLQHSQQQVTAARIYEKRTGRIPFIRRRGRFHNMGVGMEGDLRFKSRFDRCLAFSNVLCGWSSG
jgi:hypothetical protein